MRVRAHAFGAGRPGRDLLLSPDHAVFVEDVLVPIRCLIEGDGVVQERVEEIVYFHVELAAHDVILAEGLPVESYLDTGIRVDVGNGAGRFGCTPILGGVHRTPPRGRERACAPIVVSGPAVDRARVRLARTSEVGRAVIGDTPLAERYRDHPLTGDWSGFRECHVKPDPLLIYETPDADTLRLVRLGLHSELGW